MKNIFAFLLIAASCSAVDVFPMWWNDPAAPVPELAFDDGEGKPKALRILRLCPLETTKGRAGQMWTLLQKVPATEPGLPPTWKTYVQTKLAEDAQRVALLLVPSSPPQAMAVEISERSHLWGSVRFVNLTGGPIQGWIGKTTFNLPIGGQVASQVANERRTEEIVVMAPVAGSQPHVLMSSRAILDPSRRSVIFVAKLANGSVETRAIEESRDLDAAAPNNPATGGTRKPAAAAR